jgi:hypothetical protein
MFQWDIIQANNRSISTGHLQKFDEHSTKPATTATTDGGERLAKYFSAIFDLPAPTKTKRSPLIH